MTDYNPDAGPAGHASADMLEALWNLPTVVHDMDECKECGCPRGHLTSCSNYTGETVSEDNIDVFCIDGHVVSITQDQLLKLMNINHMVTDADTREPTMRLYLNSLNLDHVRYLLSIPKQELERYV